MPSEKVLQFFNIVTEGCKPQTKRVRFSHLSSFFNFLKNNLDLNFENPCDLPMLRKLFRPTVITSWTILEKDTVDEIIFRTTRIRNRLILELMARGGMRIGEVLKLRFCDIADRKLIIKDPKSGKEQEVVFIPQKVADRLRDYARQKCISPTDRIFPISYEATASHSLSEQHSSAFKCENSMYRSRSTGNTFATAIMHKRKHLSRALMVEQ